MLLKALEMLLEAPGICLQSQLQLQRLLLWLCGDQFKLEYFLSVTLAIKCLHAFLASNQTSRALSSTGCSLYCLRDVQISFTALYKHLSIQLFHK